jgi:hypothetical protein
LEISAILVGILVFASVTRVQSGHVGVLTLFGRVTGEVLPEGWEKIIFDTDIGNDIDDAFAVALANFQSRC